MHRHSHRLMSTLLFTIVLILAFFVGRRLIFKNAVGYVCNVVAERSLSPSSLRPSWRQDCLDDAERVRGWEKKNTLLRMMQARLNEVGVSHLGVYGPYEEQQLWQGKARETGLRTWAIDGRFVTADVVNNSPAARAGVRVGDEIIEINGQIPLTHWQIRSTRGEYTLGRKGRRLKVSLRTESIVIDDKPHLKIVSPGVGVLTLNSFRADLFDLKEWKTVAAQLPALDGLVVDLRDNVGGNVVAMLRVLSTLVCDNRQLGYFVRPRQGDSMGPPFPDDLSDNVQIDHLEGYGRIPIRRFADYPCFQGSLVALISDRTSSVAEMLASILKEERHRLDPAWKTQLLGSATAGDVLLAIWYPIPGFGKGYSFSVPEAVYQTKRGEVIEGVGVSPEDSISYDLDEALQGKDSGVQKALRMIQKSLL